MPFFLCSVKLYGSGQIGHWKTGATKFLFGKIRKKNEEEEEEWFVDPQKVGITDVEESDSDDDFVP